MRFGVLLAAVILVGGSLFWRDIAGVVNGHSSTKAPTTKKDKDMDGSQSSPGVHIAAKWELPDRLKEVSGIVYLDEDRFLCVQDEEGIVFVYNRSTNRIEKEIPFGGTGDYEGIALNGNTIYVVRSDGQLYEIPINDNSGINQYKTELTAEHNIEGLTYDQRNNRLLLAIKDDEPGNKNYKGIYAFDLTSKKLSMNPVYKIDLNDKILQQVNNKKKIKPSEIGIHPQSGDIYITDGPGSRLIIMDEKVNIKKVFDLGKQFVQPEGISFSPEGEVYISNEGTRQPGNILQITLDL